MDSRAYRCRADVVLCIWRAHLGQYMVSFFFFLCFFALLIFLAYSQFNVAGSRSETPLAYVRARANFVRKSSGPRAPDMAKLLLILSLAVQ